MRFKSRRNFSIYLENGVGGAKIRLLAITSRRDTRAIESRRKPVNSVTRYPPSEGYDELQQTSESIHGTLMIAMRAIDVERASRITA